jgi:iron complex transport system substrate-binding protein
MGSEYKPASGQSTLINEVTSVVIDECIRIHREIGPGLLESVYEVILAKRLQARGLTVLRQVPVPIVIDGESFGEGFRADLLINGLVVIELKSVQELSPVHFKQVQTYLRLMDLRIGLLINFGDETLVNGLHRIANRFIETSK